MHKMKGIVLAAGRGTRLAELNLKHKGFARICKKHVIDYSMDFLTDNKDGPIVSEIIVVVGYHAEEIMNYIGDSYNGVPVKFVFQHELKGIAHAVMVASDSLNDDFIMCLADEIMIHPKLTEMVRCFEESNADVVCGVVIDGSDFSMKPIAYDVDENGTITKVTEKPKGYHNDIRGIGECIFKRRTLEYLKTLPPNQIRGELEMGDWIQSVIDAGGTAKAFKLADAYVNVNYPKDIETANKLLQDENRLK